MERWGVKVKLDDGCSSLVCVRCFSPFSFFRFGKLQGTNRTERSVAFGRIENRSTSSVCSDRRRRAFGAFAVPARARLFFLAHVSLSKITGHSVSTAISDDIFRVGGAGGIRDEVQRSRRRRTTRTYPTAPAADDGAAQHHSETQSVSLSPRLEEAHFPLAA